MGNVDADDEGLWSRSIKGDGEAFGVLYIRHRDRVFRNAYRLSGDRRDAEDIMATAFLELRRRRRKVRPVEGFILPWLLVTTTTTNTARNNGRAALPADVPRAALRSRRIASGMISASTSKEMRPYIRGPPIEVPG